jgi:predicted secreted protein
MSLTGAIALYFIIWWLVLFAVLPFGIRSQHETGQVQVGTDPGAPVGVRARRVILINSLVAAVVFVIVWFVYVENVFGLEMLRDLVRR